MNGLLGYLVFQVLPAVGVLFFTIYLAYIITSPTRLKAKMSKHKEGTPRYEVYRKFYNKEFLGGWICITLFFVSGIAFDTYRSMYTPPFFVLMAMLLLTFAIIFTGWALIGRALKK